MVEKLRIKINSINCVIQSMIRYEEINVIRIV